MPGCVYCADDAPEGLWSDAHCRVLLIDDAAFPGFCRVVWHAHVAEFSDLSAADRVHLMAVVNAVEGAQRALLLPDKINLASFGNMVPHLHWHVIPRYRDDSHFPEPTWGPQQRAAPTRALPVGFASALKHKLDTTFSR